MRGHHALLSSLSPFQRQIWPLCRSTPRARGMELSTAPTGAHPPAGTAAGPVEVPSEPVCPVSVCPERSHHNRGRSRPASAAGGWAGTGSPGAPGTSPALSPSLSPALGKPSPAPASPASKALQSRHHRKEGIPTPAPGSSPRAAFGITPAFMKLLFWKSCRSAAFCSIFPIPASRRFSRTPCAFSEMSNPRRSPQHLQCFVTALAKC